MQLGFKVTFFCAVQDLIHWSPGLIARDPVYSGDKNKNHHKPAKDTSTSAPTLPQEAHILDDVVKKLNYIYISD